MGATGLEPVTPSVSSKETPDASGEGKGLTADLPDRCTPGCTNPAETPKAGTVEALAAALLGLSPDDRARLTAMLLGQQEGK
jgi:hypothetical protein